MTFVRPGLALMLLSTIFVTAYAADLLPRRVSAASVPAVDRTSADIWTPAAPLSLGGTSAAENITALANGLSMGSASYELQGNQAVLHATSISNSRSGGISGTLRLELWATSTRPVFGGIINHYAIAGYTLGQLSGGTQWSSVSSGTVSATRPPTGTYYMSMVLLEWNGSAYVYQVIGVMNPEQQSFGIFLQVPFTATFGATTVRITAAAVSKSSGGTSGTLRLELVATTARPVPNNVPSSGYKLAYATLGTLPEGTQFSNIDVSVPWVPPPNGTYYLSLFVTEYTSSGTFEWDDFGVFQDPFVWGTPPQACTYSIDSSSATYGASGGKGSVTVTGTPSGCTGTWAATTSSSWIALGSLTTGSGPGPTTVTYTVQPSASASSRVGVITVAGNTFTVSQAGTATNICTADAKTACALNGRFRITVRYRSAFDNGPVDKDASIKSVAAFVTPSFETTAFYFNDANNVEVFLKLLDQGNTDGQGHQTIAVLFGTATPLRTEVTITDTANSVTKKYSSPFGSSAGASDFTAFVK